jgi:putative ABC transport system ATP-binding protein
MSYHALPTVETIGELVRFYRIILGPEKRYYVLTLIYGIGISLLTLSTPISVQMLVNTVAHTGLTTPLLVLSVTLFALLAASGLLNALRIHLMDLFTRRFYARMVAEISLRAIYAVNPFFDDASRGQLFNRYFDIMVVVKSLPNLLIGGFTIVLQAGVGFVLVSLYHPFFFVFNMVLVGLIWVIWLVWGRAAILSGIELSHRKHATAAWLQGLGASNGFFKSERHIEEALARTETATAAYIDQHRRHFRHHFAQTLGFLLLYAGASAVLLGLGGWLVIQGQLTLGQLVAAELVLSVAFVGLSQFGVYLTYFYDLSAAIEELSLFEGVEQEDPLAHRQAIPEDGSLRFVGVVGETRGTTSRLDLEIPGGARVLAKSETHAPVRQFNNFMKGHDRVTTGLVTLGGIDIEDIGLQALRRAIIVLDRPNTIEMSIREYLRLSARDGSGRALLEAVEAVGLEPTIAQLEEGLDTTIAATGWPLSITETMQLKLASAILAEPRVLIMSPLFDVLPDDRLDAALDLLQARSRTTVIYFSNHHLHQEFDVYLYMTADEQLVTRDWQAFRSRAGLDDDGRPPLLPPRDDGGDA